MKPADLAILLNLAVMFAPPLIAARGYIWAGIKQFVDELFSELCMRLAAWSFAPPEWAV